MRVKPKARILEHVHGLLAGSLLVVALFVLATVPFAMLLVLRGEGGASAFLYPIVFLALLWAVLREARSWHLHISSQAQ